MDCNKNEICEAKKDPGCIQNSVETNNNFEPHKEMGSSGGGDIDSVQSDGAKINESREERLQRLKDKSESERQRKYTEILESQRQANESRQKLQEERRKKIGELKMREEERKKKVEQRRHELNIKEKEKNENLLRRTMEREARAGLIQKQTKPNPSMVQSMTCGNAVRMTSSSHNIGCGPEKCKRVSHRSSSGCDVDRVSSYVLQAAASSTAKRPVLGSEGFIEVHGHIIPANTRHVGCFLPYRGPQHRVKGVLAWRLPSDRLVSRGGSVAWWAGFSDRDSGSRSTVGHMHRRASSAHAALAYSNGRYRKELVMSTRVRSSSRPINPMVHSSRVSTPRKSLGDQSLYDRLSRPRVESQPPKNRDHESSLECGHRQKDMSTSCVTPSKRLVSGPLPTTIADKNISHKRRSLPSSAPDSGITSSPASEMESVHEPRDRDLVTTLPSNTFVSGNVSYSKSRPRTTNKNLRSKDPDPINDGDGTVDSTKVSTINNEEEVYRVKLAEQRRLARETKERQLEEQRILEEEAKEKALAEKLRIEQETSRIMEEEIKRLKELEEEKQATLEKQKMDEEIQRIEHEELERVVVEKRMEKSRSEDSDRMERKRRLEKIMSRVKRPEDSSSQSNEDSVLGVSDILENSVVDDRRGDLLGEEVHLEDTGEDRNHVSLVEPLNAWHEESEEVTRDVVIEHEEAVVIGAQDNVSNTGSPSLISDYILDLPGPEMNNSQMSHSGTSYAPGPCDQVTSIAPQFKSRLLQSIMARSRVSSTDFLPDLQITTYNDDISDGDKLSQSQFNTGSAMHSRTYDNDVSQISGTMTDFDQSRDSHSYESRDNAPSDSVWCSKHHSDSDNEFTMSSLGSGHVGLNCVPLPDCDSEGVSVGVCD